MGKGVQSDRLILSGVDTFRDNTYTKQKQYIYKLYIRSYFMKKTFTNHTQEIERRNK